MSGPVSKVHAVGVVGPLAPFADGFKARLGELGYTPLTTVNELRLVLHVSRWLEVGGLAVADLTSDRVDEYFAARRAAGYRASTTPRSLVQLVRFLTDSGVLSPAAPSPAASGSQTDALLDAFEVFLIDERGLAGCTARAYVARARRFLGWCAPDGDVDRLVTADVTGAVAREVGLVSVGSVQFFVAGVRAFLRFCHVRGLIGADLSAAALAVTGRRSSFLPKGISQGDARALLSSCDRRTPAGHRDFAVLTVLMRLGLRASEVASLTLDDFDWRVGEITVHGKAGRVDRLPVPVEVGEAVTAYLVRGRPASSRREMFLRLLAPVVGLGRGGVSMIVRNACDRAGLPQIGAHRLRHTLACTMVAAGVSLPDIGQVLRHRNISSTAIYARVDIDMLRGVAQPWPTR